MKEISKKTKEDIAIVKQAEINKGLKFVGRQRIHRGHTMWQFNIMTGELIPAKIESQTVLTKEGTRNKKKITTVEGCQYFPALNRKNAIKKLNKIGLWVKN